MKQERLLDMSSGTGPLGPSRKVKAAIRRAVKEIGAPAGQEAERLQRLLHSKFGIPPDGVLFSSSLRELLHLLPAVFRPSRALIIGPAPGIYAAAASVAGARVSVFNAPEDEGFLPAADLLSRALEDADMLFISNPNRITGNMISRKALFDTLERASERGIWSVVDESLVEFAGDDGFFCDALSRGKIVVLRTTSNFYALPGLELAYAVSSPETIKALDRAGHSDVSRLSVEAAMTALKDKAYRKNTLEFIEEEKGSLARAFSKLQGVKAYDSEANVYLLRIEASKDDIVRSFLRAGLLPSLYEEEGGRFFLRLSVMTHDANRKLIRVVRSLCEVPSRPLG